MADWQQRRVHTLGGREGHVLTALQEPVERGGWVKGQRVLGGQTSGYKIHKSWGCHVQRGDHR